MAEQTKLVVKKRTELGTAACRRLRKEGLVPGNVYGHERPPVAIAVGADRLESLLRAGQHVVECDIDGDVETAIFRDVQWNTYATDPVHFDLVRIDPTKRVTVEVHVELRGTSPGALAGGILEQPLHTLTVDCLPAQIPDSVVVRINELNIGDSVHVSDLDLPETVHCQNPPEAAVVQVVPPLEVPEEVEEEAEAGPAEPEVIGQKEEEGEGEAEEG